MDENRCKQEIRIAGLSWPRWTQCSFKIVKDGYCKIHHPDYIKKKREEKRKNSLPVKYMEARKHIEKLEKKVKKLERELGLKNA